MLRLEGGRAVVSTADFFTPVVDDAYDWGRIAAADALSDVYAVGGVPLMALNLLGWPADALPAELAREVLRGGRDTAALAASRSPQGTASRTPSRSTASRSPAPPTRTGCCGWTRAVPACRSR
ncbi:AIR synthase related protein [Actinomadura luteofluorescens]|uniref:AIR synthase related protein n=1 Tax=Actinomadura luteofluorescens TaxID=46163 RepID=UPI0036321799